VIAAGSVFALVFCGALGLVLWNGRSPPPATTTGAAADGPDPQIGDGRHDRIATFARDRFQVFCREHYRKPDLGAPGGYAYDVVRYAGARWDIGEVAPDRWDKSGCARAVAAHGEVVGIVDAYSRMFDTMPNTPRFAQQKARLTINIARVRRMQSLVDQGKTPEDPQMYDALRVPRKAVIG
jgi:hypothetical protein